MTTINVTTYQPLYLSDEQLAALRDALSYYAMSDYGCGDQRPLSDEQKDHRARCHEVERALDDAR